MKDRGVMIAPAWGLIRSLVAEVVRLLASHRGVESLSH